MTPAPGRPRTVAVATAIVTLGLLALLSRGPDGALGTNYLASVLLTVTLFALFSLGVSLTYGQTGLVNFGHVAFLAIGAYSAAMVPLQSGLGWWAAIPVALMVSAAYALLVGLPTLRLREDYLAIVTIAAAEILRTVLMNGEPWTGGELGLTGFERPFIGPMGGDPDVRPNGAWSALASALEVRPYGLFLLVLSLIVLAMSVLVLHRLRHSPWGRVTRAIRDDEDATAALGKDVFRYKLSSLMLGGALGTLAGLLHAWAYPSVTPGNFLPLVTFYAWAIMILGGATTHLGPLVGSVLLWGLFEGVRAVSVGGGGGPFANEGALQVALVGLLLVLLMRFRPQGLVGDARELSHAR